MMNVNELRRFLHLGARAEAEGIPERDIQRQEDTILRALELLDERPGVVLADEVGLGKTFEALGVAAAFRERNPAGRILILTPGPDLNRKWSKELAGFGDKQRTVYDFGESYKAVSWLGELLSAFSTHSVVIAPISMFGTKTDAGTHAYLLSLFFHWKKLHGHTANAILDRFRGGALSRVDIRKARFLDWASWEQVAPHLDTVFTSLDGDEKVGLATLYEKHGYGGFERDDVVRRALDLARFRLVRALLPAIDLLILDEAHKLKNEDTVRARGVSEIFAGRFEKALFLTATPFQLDVRELRQVFKLFSLATTAPAGLVESVESLFDDIRSYQQAYSDFEALWLRADPAVVEAFRIAYDSDPALTSLPDDVAVRDIASKAKRLFELKTERIEPTFRSWMIRSVREDKRQYRRHTRHKNQPDASSVPFLLYERFLAELFRRGEQTHKASVEINMVSSYGAAVEGALLASGSDDRFTGELDEYRTLLRTVLGQLRTTGADHPKLRFVVSEVLEAAQRGEKTLIFCARIATIRDLARMLSDAWHDHLLGRWQAVYPGESDLDLLGGTTTEDAARNDTTIPPPPEGTEERRVERHRAVGRHGLLQRRFHAGRDALYLALRERYVQSLLHVGDWPLENLDEIVARANVLLKQVRTSRSRSERLDYQIAKRCLERATAIFWSESEPAQASDYADAMAQLTDERYVALGLDLVADDLEEGEDEVGDLTPTWTISTDVARTVLAARASIWSFMSSELSAFDYRMRVRLVERVARYLTSKDVSFMVDVVSAAKQAGLDVDSLPSHAVLDLLESFWRQDAGRRWVDRIKAFLQYIGARTEQEQRDLIDGPIIRATLVRHTVDGEKRENLREAFNTPLFPMILIANEVMQEGLDLHRNCRRIIHHDLAWNPAQLEQRVGRIDRLGSLTLNLRKKNPDARLDVLYPLVHGTIDERIYRMVKTREKWLEFLLGAAPDYATYALDDAPPPPLPDGFAERLRIDLRPVQ